MGEDNLEKNRSLEHETMQLEKLDIELTYELLCNLCNFMQLYETMQLMQQYFDDILT
jgi:hypothetical protein